jgi:tetratricopeptide (TPR) repeat protein
MTGDWVKAELYRFSYGPFSREMETRADFLAVDLMVRAGLNPVAGSQPIEDLYEKYDNSIKKRLQNQLKDVQKTIEGSLAQLTKCAPDMLKESFNGRSLNDQLHSFLKEQIVGWTTQFIAGRFNREKVHIYASADERVKAIHDYAAKFYPGKIVDNSADLSKFGGGGGSSGTGGGAGAFDAFTHEDGIYQSTEKIVGLNSQGKYDEAMDEVGKAEKASGARPLDFLVAAGTAAKGDGKTERAIGYYEQAAGKPEAIAVVFRSLADLYVENRQTDKAIGALDRGEAKLKDKKQFIVSRISVYHAKGDDARVAKLMKQCEDLGDSALTDQCHDAGEVKTAGLMDGAGKTAGNVMDKTGETAGKALNVTGKAAGSLFHGLKSAVTGDDKKSN